MEGGGKVGMSRWGLGWGLGWVDRGCGVEVAEGIVDDGKVGLGRVECCLTNTRNGYGGRSGSGSGSRAGDQARVSVDHGQTPVESQATSLPGRLDVTQ